MTEHHSDETRTHLVLTQDTMVQHYRILERSLLTKGGIDG